MHRKDVAIVSLILSVMLLSGAVLSDGSYAADVTEVITPENIRTVYEVEIKIDDSYGRPHVVIP